jgi:hypothetical protein
MKVRLVKLHCYPNKEYDHIEIFDGLFFKLHEDCYCYKHMKYGEIIGKKVIEI